MKGGEQKLNLPAGFRFHPTDEELVVHYLCRKCSGQQISVSIIADIDLYKFDPWELPGVALYGEKEWYFFSPRDRKYPNGSRPNRMAGTGYWKATGVDKPIGKPKTLGIKKALVFYAGKAPTGVKTNWIMHEYRLANVDRSAGKRTNWRLDDWVLCRIYNKKGSTIGKHFKMEDKAKTLISDCEDQKPEIDALTMYNGMQAPSKSLPLQQTNEYLPNVLTHSSGLEHDSLPEFKCKTEVQNFPMWSSFEDYIASQHTSYLGGFQDNDGPFGSQMLHNYQCSVLQDMFP